MYQALYRVYRPQTFTDMVGQELISTTLQNAVMLQKISHGYLFSGPRGTGKTSAAKIFAKAINCPNQQNGQPCNSCHICQSITNGSLADVIEIDAASNNGVEDIRDIRDKSRYAPTQATYKVYIIDEVHMLSTGAFNALLKTLEEPTKNVVFILATTEVHKIPETILSRVQRFEFKRILNSDIEKRLKYVLNEQQQAFDDEAIKLIARSAKGGMRDALSLLDQALSYSNEQLSYEEALQVTGSVNNDTLLNYMTALYHHDTQQAIHIVNDMLEKGKDVSRFVDELLLLSRDLLVAKVVESAYIAQEVANQFDDKFIYRVIDVLNDVQLQMKQTLQQDLYMEIATIKLSQQYVAPQQSQDNIPRQMIEELERLKEDINNLKNELSTLKSDNKSVKEVPRTKKVGAVAKEFEVNLPKIFNILSKATRQDKDKVANDWEDILSCLDVAQRAKLNASTILAASQAGVVVGFEYPILCSMTQNDTQLQQNLSTHAMRIIQHPCHIECLPIQQWKDIRQKFLQAQSSGTLSQYISQDDIMTTDDSLFVEEDDIEKIEDSPIVAQAKALFGDIVEVEEN